MRARIRLATLLLIVASALPSCSRSGPHESDPQAGEEAAETQLSATGGQVGAPDQKAADAKLANSISIAELYSRHGDYAEAEKTLREALADQVATDRASALSLLEQVLAKRAELAANSSGASPPATNAAVPPETAPSPAESATAPTEPTTVVEAAAADGKPGKRAADPESSTEEASAGEAPAPPARIVKVPAEDRQITAVVEAATDISTPSDALDLYDDFVARRTLTAEQEKRIQKQLGIWRERLEMKLVRFGTRWVTAEEAKAAAERANEHITGALAAIENNELSRAVGMLKRASTTDPSGVRADFILGMLNSLRGSNDPITAKRHFRTIVARSPENVAALNNLALAEIKLGEYSEAYAHWKRAVQVSPTTPELIQNLGRLAVEIQRGKLAIPSEWAGKFEQLYSEALKLAGGQQPDLSVGWLYVPQVLAEPENDAEGDRQTGSKPSGSESTAPEPSRPKPALPLVALGSGSGFVVHRDYILTNRHVVQDERYGVADAFKIVDPADPAHSRAFDATIVAVSNRYDVALLKCPDLKAGPVPLATELPKRGSDVLVLGYPRSQDFGRNLKATRGIVTALPDASDPDFKDMLLFDAEANPGNSGGPVCDQFGRAIALMTFITGRQRIGQYSGGVPAAFAVPFVQQHAPDYRIGEANGERLEWPDVDAKVSPSTVLVLVYYEGAPFSVATPDQAKIAKERSPLEDVSCSVCNGHARIPCPADGCSRGVITVMVNKQFVQGSGPARVVQNIRVPVKNRCSTCRGAGALDCQHCIDGTDPSLFRR